MSRKKGLKEFNFLNALASGKTISRRQARAQYKLDNPSSAILRFVQAGVFIDREYAPQRIRSKTTGEMITASTVKYRIIN